MDLITIFLLIFVVQMVFFALASYFKTDKFTDISYGATFSIVALSLLVANPAPTLVSLAMALVVAAWGFRLAGYLFYRIMKIKTDKRFDGIRENFFAFLKFWLVQAVAIFIILLPTLIVLLKPELELVPLSLLGLAISVFGIVYESIADQQKFKFKSDPQNAGKVMRTGLWKYSRHPNYFGEILMWVGVFIFAAFYLSGLEFASVISPLFIFVLLRFFSGVPTLEKKYKDNPEYVEYMASTPMFVPRLWRS